MYTSVSQMTTDMLNSDLS